MDRVKARNAIMAALEEVNKGQPTYTVLHHETLEVVLETDDLGKAQDIADEVGGFVIEGLIIYREGDREP